MPRQNAYFHALNAGEVDKEALGRLDLQKMRLAGETYENLLCRVLGPAFLRPGMECIGEIPNASSPVPEGFTAADVNRMRYLRFDGSSSRQSLVELTPFAARFWINGSTLLSRPVVTAAIANPTFTAGLAGWTQVYEGTPAISGGAFGLSIATQSVGGWSSVRQSVAVAQPGSEHAIRLIVRRNDVLLRIGSTAGGDEYQEETLLGPGVHSISFTPAGDFHVTIKATTAFPAVVESCAVETGGIVSLATPWDAVAIRRLNTDQSIDVLYCAEGRNPHYRIERRGVRSWSIVRHVPKDGPVTKAATSTVRIRPTVLTGSGSLLTDGGAFFRPDHVGAVFRLFHSGQRVEAILNKENTFSPPVRIAGIGTDRFITYSVSGTFVATITLQRTYESEDAGWTDVINASGGTTTYGDANTNQIGWYRLAIKPGNYTSGDVSVAVSYPGGGGYGLARVTGYVSPTEVTMDVVQRFKQVTTTDQWQEGEWSDRRGWQGATALFDGRLWWAGRDRFNGSASDAFSTFDLDAVEGDAGPIIRSIGTGASNEIRWMMPLQRLIIGTTSREVSVRSSAFDAPLTPTDLTVKTASTFGSAALPALVVDRAGLFIAKNGKTLVEMAYSVDAQDYAALDLTRLNPSILSSGVVAMAVQRHPDTRIWLVLFDGTARCLTYERREEVVAFSRITTPGLIRGVAVLPGDTQDRVFFCVERNGVLYHERMALDSDAKGSNAIMLDNCERWTGAATATIPAPARFNGRQVTVWANSKAFGPLTVTSGQAVISEPATSAVVGLAYTGKFKSVKLGYASAFVAAAQTKRVDNIGLLLADTHHKSIRYGTSFDYLQPLPGVIDGQTVSDTQIWSQKDIGLEPVNGTFSLDERICFTAQSPYPATVMGVVFSISTHDRI